MPYDSKQKLPNGVQNSLPEHAQEIYLEAYNSAYEEHSQEEDREQTAHRIAWGAVKNVYEKNATGNWTKKDSKW